MADDIKIRIGLEGDADIKKKLDNIRDSGQKFGHDISNSINQAVQTNPALGKGFGAEEGLERSRVAAERLREVVHTLHPVLESAGLGLGNLGSFARVAGAGMGAFAAAIVGSVVLGLAKLGDEIQKSKLNLSALGASGDAFDKLNDRAKKLGISTAALVPGLQQYREAVNKTDADLTKTVSHPPGYKPNETEPDVRIIGGGKETGARVPAETFLTAHSALIESGQSEKISGDEAAKQADAFEKKLLDNRQLTAEAVGELSPSAANNLAKAVEPFFGTSLKDGAALVAQLNRPGARLPSDNETLRALAKSEPGAAKQAEAAKGVVAGFEAVAAASKRLAEKLAGDGSTIGKGLTGTAKVIDAIAAAEHKSAAGSGLAASATPPLLDFLKSFASKPPSQRVAEGFDQFKPKSADGPAAPPSTAAPTAAAAPAAVSDKPALAPRPSAAADTAPLYRPLHGPDPTGPAQEGTPISRAIDLKSDVRNSSDAAVSSHAAAPSAAPTSGRIVPKLNDDGSVNPYGGLPNNRPHPDDGYTNPYGQAPRNEAERRQQEHESAAVNKQAAEDQKLFNQNIRDQNGGNSPSPDKNNYAPPTLGHYDPRSQEFLANPKQPARDPNAVPGAPHALTFPAYDRKLTKEFQDKYGPSMNPPGVENPFPSDHPVREGSAPPDVNPGAPGRNPGDAPLQRVYIGLPPEEEQKRREEDLRKIEDERKANGPRSDLDDNTDAAVTVATGGHIRGPGTSTSDSIPAMLSDGEYVMKASAVSRIGVDKLDAANNGVAHFADGGQVKPGPAPADPPILGSLSITYDPVTGGAYVNGVLRRPGDPILNDPRVKKGIEESKTGAKDAPQEKQKDPFVGDYGDGRETGDTGNTPGFAEGGIVGSAPSASRFEQIISHFAEGGRVHLAQGGVAALRDRLSAMGMSSIEMPHLAIGGMPEMPSVDLSDKPAFKPAAASGMEHWGKIDLTTNHGEFQVATERDTMRHISSAAQKAKRYSTGPKPSWYGGGGR